MDILKKFSLFSILGILLLIPLASSAYAQGYDIPDIPNMEDFDIPSQEEIKAMMESKKVSGKYTNSEHGVEVTFPDGWSGVKYEINETDYSEVSVVTIEGGIQANMNSIQNDRFRIIALSILDREDDEPPELEVPTFEEGEEYNFDCKITSSEKTKVNGMNSFKSIIECSGGNTSIKGKSHNFATEDKWIMLIYAASPSTDYEKDISKYDSAVSTISISNSVDFEFEIPEELKSNEAAPTPTSNSDKDAKPKIPEWIKSNAEWWSKDQIDDGTFVSGIQFLIKEGILNVPQTNSASPQEGNTGIPGWIKSNAEWWAQGLLTEDDFLKGIQYLVEKGIIRV